MASVLAIGVASVVGPAQGARAQRQVFWTGRAGDLYWSDNSNWMPTPPISSDTVVLGFADDVAIPFSNFVNLDVSATVDNLQFETPDGYGVGSAKGPGYFQLFATGNSILTLTGGLSNYGNTGFPSTTLAAPIVVKGSNDWTNALDGTLNVSGTVSLVGNLTTNSVGAVGQGYIQIASDISGAGNLTVASGVLGLSGNNTYTGTTTVKSGATLELSNSVGSGKVTLDAGSVLDISRAANEVSIDALGGSGKILLGSQTLVLGFANGNHTLSGVIENGPEGSGGGIEKTGSGTLTLTGANTYTGTTSVYSGTIVISGGGKYGELLSFENNAVADFDSGTLQNATALNSGVINLKGGKIGLAQSYEGGTINIYSGASVGTVIVDDPATVNIYGGTFSSAIQNNDPTDSFINIFGSNFSLSDPTSSDGYVVWDLTGLLSDGEMLNSTYEVAGSNMTAAPGINFSSAASAPEPSALMLLVPGISLAALVLRRRPAKSR